jgi:actin-related protein 4
MSDKTIAPQVYGADEINALVLDPGSYTTQAGFAGFDQPSIVTPSYYGTFSDNNGELSKVFDENVLFSNSKDGLEVKPIISNNLIIDWDGAMNQFKYIFEKLQVNSNEQPLLLTESTMNSYENKIKAMEFFFEEENFCAFYSVKQPTCISFAHGRPNCLVVDVGHDLLTVTPVIDGLCLRNQVRGTKYSGSFLNQQLRQFLKNKEINYYAPIQVKNKQCIYWENNETTPKFKLIDENINQSVIDFSYLRTLREMKELLLECCMDDEIRIPTDLKEEIDNDNTRWFELPNGLNVPFTLYERQKISNSLFNPIDTLDEIVVGWEDLYDGNIIKKIGTEKDITSKDYIPLRRSKKAEEEENSTSNADGNNIETNNINESNIENSNTVENNNNNNNINEDNEESKEAVGITKLVQNVLNNLDIDLKPQLANNIVLTGSTTLIPRLNERLNNELMLLNPSLKIRVHSAGNPTERRHASWIGGSILSSLGTFHQLWVSKAEYEEVGPDQLIINRFR